MNIILTIMGLIALSIAFCVFWWAMIEAQTDIPGVNEPNTYGPRRLDCQNQLNIKDKENDDG